MNNIDCNLNYIYDKLPHRKKKIDFFITSDQSNYLTGETIKVNGLQLML